MNRISLVVTITDVHQLSGGDIYSITATVDGGPYGGITMYAGQIGRILMERLGDDDNDKPVKIEVTPGPLGLRIVSLCTEWVDAE